jgi:hypothetical protein
MMFRVRKCPLCGRKLQVERTKPHSKDTNLIAVCKNKRCKNLRIHGNGPYWLCDGTFIGRGLPCPNCGNPLKQLTENISICVNSKCIHYNNHKKIKVEFEDKIMVVGRI